MRASVRSLAGCVMGVRLSAVKWLLKAANADHTDAMIVLGATLMSGDGVEVNYRLGASWFQKAADLGNAEAMHELATFHIDGDGVEADSEKRQRHGSNQCG